MAKQNLESSVEGRKVTDRKIIADKKIIPAWKPDYTESQIRYWLKSYWNANRIALPENLDAMKREQLYAIYKRISED